MHSPVFGAVDGYRDVRPKSGIQEEFIISVCETKDSSQMHSKLYLSSTVFEVHRLWNKAGTFDRKEQIKSKAHSLF